MAKLTYLVIHCTATPGGREVSSDQIRQWHLGPCKQANEKILFNGKIYDALSALPPQLIGGASVYKIAGRGWRQLGYSDMIHLDGSIENLVPYNNDDKVDAWEITNGQPGINYLARHLVYAGGCAQDGKTPEDTRTPAQHKALEAYVKGLIAKHPSIKIAGHNQFAKKACPSFSVVQWALAKAIERKNIYKHETQNIKQ